MKAVERSPSTVFFKEANQTEAIAMDPRMLKQNESQPKLHRIFVDGHEVFSSNVLLQALLQFNRIQEESSTCNVEFQSECTYGEKKS